MKITLYIDTSDSQKTIVGIFRDKEKKYFVEKTKIYKSQNLLPLIEKSLSNFSCHSRPDYVGINSSGNLNQNKLTLLDINEIQVNAGPGSFTGIRVGITVANTLGWVLNVPVNGKKIALPEYQTSKFDD